MRSATAVLVALLALAVACGEGTPRPHGATAPSSGPADATGTPMTAPTPLPAAGPPVLETVVANARFPVALAPSPDGRLFYAELETGQVRVVRDGRLLPEPFATFQVAHPPGYSEHGLLGIALHPDFPQQPYVYVFYTVPDAQGRPQQQRVVRLRAEGDRGVEPVTVVDGLPAGPTCCHNGGRLAFGPDGMLYVSLGDAQAAALAQDPQRPNGKVLRLRPDGSLPPDNPFPGSPAYALGFRNPFGLAFHPGSGELLVTDNGPSGRDELNVVRRGANYGWPTVMGRAGDGRFVDPIWESGGRSTAPTGLAIYWGDALPFRGDLFFCTYLGRRLLRVPAEQMEAVRQGARQTVEPQDTGYPCQLDVKQAPDGSLYFSDAENIYRLRPAP
ncbi:MAG TPA: PQQ-dependent sugar dehydrogenase [Dehalococcoidia bacterium]|nr:PQQ-dependent sugar dehydrogenase [Dehalococcoidia bacterium]